MRDGVAVSCWDCGRDGDHAPDCGESRRAFALEPIDLLFQSGFDEAERRALASLQARESPPPEGMISLAVPRQGHPPGYHKSEEARARCWGCSHPEKLEVTKADEAEALELYRAGFRPVSNKSCMVARANLPSFDNAVNTLEMPRWFADRLRYMYENAIDLARVSDNPEIEKRVLKLGVYRAIKRLGGSR